MIGRQVFYEGRVQGVGFRFTCKQIARGYEVVCETSGSQDVARLPDGWGPVFHDPYSLIPRRPGAVAGSLRVHGSGRYQLWLQGSFAVGLEVRIDGREVASASRQLGPQGQAVPIGELPLGAGKHRV